MRRVADEGRYEKAEGEERRSDDLWGREEPRWTLIESGLKHGWEASVSASVLALPSPSSFSPNCLSVLRFDVCRQFNPNMQNQPTHSDHPQFLIRLNSIATPAKPIVEERSKEFIETLKNNESIQNSCSSTRRWTVEVLLAFRNATSLKMENPYFEGITLSQTREANLKIWVEEYLML